MNGSHLDDSTPIGTNPMLETKPLTESTKSSTIMAPDQQHDVLQEEVHSVLASEVYYGSTAAHI